MKQFIFLLIPVVLIVQAQAQDPTAKFKWKTETFDFGKIPKDIPVTHEFHFVNVGKETMIITNVQTSCGCAEPSWTKDMIPPTASGSVKITYNAATPGIFNKSVTVSANVDTGVAVLHIKGEVADKLETKQPDETKSVSKTTKQ